MRYKLLATPNRHPATKRWYLTFSVVEWNANANCWVASGLGGTGSPYAAAGMVLMLNRYGDGKENSPDWSGPTDDYLNGRCRTCGVAVAADAAAKSEVKVA